METHFYINFVAIIIIRIRTSNVSVCMLVLLDTIGDDGSSAYMVRMNFSNFAEVQIFFFMRTLSFTYNT